MNFKQFRQKALENPEVHQEYDALQEEFSLIDQALLRKTLRKSSEPTKATSRGLREAVATQAGERSTNTQQPVAFG